MTNNSLDTSIEWDVIVVGTGIGGATIGNALAQKGLSVLFLERGGRVSPPDSDAEETAPERRLARGWWPYRVSHRQANGTYRRFFAAVGCALGGSSVHYAAALERMPESDFAALHTSAAQVGPWPVSFKDFLPYYIAAEKLFRADEVPPEAIMQRMSEWDRALMDQMRENGLHPEPLHVAIRYDAQCKECIGTICTRNCKSDALAACVDVALRLPNCKIIEHCDVQSLEADSNRIRVVRALCKGRELSLTAKIVVLAAGALHSPQLLLRSSNEFWPNGLANSSDQVGRNLMFHTSDIFAIWAPRRLDRRGRQKKSISVRDFYLQEGQRLGYVQSMGLDAGRGTISSFLKDQFRRLGLRNELLLSLLVKAPSHIGTSIFGQAGLFAGMTEDDPNPNNRISLDPNEPDGASFTYTITDDLRRRAQGLYSAFARCVRPWRVVRISPRLDMNYGHPCGTCRFGDDPAHNVLDRNCRTHDIDNLYVVDASFMPRSGAVNPSLTIAANALRVATHITKQTPTCPATTKDAGRPDSDE
ncbi:MAG: GMC family oxidoreductase [Steroidobacteraceae bacterium]|jgi:choline dehydrogenase-like flavoprotein